jgi:hypothetical protein
MQNRTLLSLIFLLIFTTVSCGSKMPPSQEQASKPSAKATPAPSLTYHISGTIDDAVQEGDVCDVSLPFTVPGTLKFEFTPSSARKGTYTYSGPFNATGSGPYEIFDNGKMLVSGTGCIMGKCADYSHDWKVKPIGPQACGKTK